MKATISMSRSNLWKMIQAMSLNADNKLWLGEKLIEEARKEVAENAPCQYSVEDLSNASANPCRVIAKATAVPVTNCARSIPYANSLDKRGTGGYREYLSVLGIQE